MWMGSSSIKDGGLGFWPFSEDLTSRVLPISLFQMLRDIIAGGGGMVR